LGTVNMPMLFRARNHRFSPMMAQLIVVVSALRADFEPEAQRYS